MLRPGWRCREGGVWEYALSGVTRTADEWATVLTTKPAAAKSRSTVDPAVAAARAAHASNSPLALGAASDPAGGGAANGAADGEVSDRELP